jgi:hypothetical protein
VGDCALQSNRELKLLCRDSDFNAEIARSIYSHPLPANERWIAVPSNETGSGPQYKHKNRVVEFAGVSASRKSSAGQSEIALSGKSKLRLPVRVSNYAIRWLENWKVRYSDKRGY